METSSTILLVLSCAVCFGLVRLFVYLRDKKREKQAREQAAQAPRDRPPETESRNRSKRRRQLQQLEKKSGRAQR